MTRQQQMELTRLSAAIHAAKTPEAKSRAEKARDDFQAKAVKENNVSEGGFLPVDEDGDPL